MPISEKETHPYIEQGQIIKASRMFLGTFPIYSVTAPDSPVKEKMRKEQDAIPFFYGNYKNYFWEWYANYIDNSMTDESGPEDYLKSLRKHNIGISDVIRSCERVDFSSNDKDLMNIEWNHSLAQRIEKGVRKIIVTSKSKKGAMGWLKDEILIPANFRFYAPGTLALHNHIMKSIPGSISPANVIAQVMEKDGELIEMVSLPSPGSPYRRLDGFGRNSDIHESKEYLQTYLKVVFDWFMD